jgi:hypothetical protein
MVVAAVGLSPEAEAGDPAASRIRMSGSAREAGGDSRRIIKNAVGKQQKTERHDG